jgi:hypothetical protein
MYFHVHAIMLSLWILVLIIQPILIRKKKLAVHRLIGKFTYVLFPLMIFVGISINLTKILAFPPLVTRGSFSLILIMSILIFSLLLLITKEGYVFIGYILAITGVALCIAVLRADI